MQARAWELHVTRGRATGDSSDVLEKVMHGIHFVEVAFPAVAPNPEPGECIG
jgi:hypothetical protein